MKQLKYLLIITCCLLTGLGTLKAQNGAAGDSTGLPGDNFSLQGALEMFKKASSVEEFEKLINTEGNNVNNLDLNEDGDIDYIRVIDKMENDVHAFVLQAVVAESESQDIAVIELEKTGDGTAILQIIGDEDIYGEKVIVEPGDGDDDGTFIDNDKPATAGPSFNYNDQRTGIVVNVWLWPCVRFVYAPVYHPWVSPWRWRVFPGYWHPWHPLAWRVYHPLRMRYHVGFAVVHTHRVIHAHTVYSRGRVTSVTVHTRNNARVTRFRTTKTNTYETPRGKVKVKETKVRTRGRRG